MEEHWERFIQSTRSQNETSVSQPISAQRTPASTEEFFQSGSEANNNTNNPFDQRKPGPSKIWFTPLSHLLRPDILVAQPPRMVSPAVLPPPVPINHQNLSVPRPFREQHVLPDASHSREALRFLHHYLATNMHPEPQSSKLGYLSLYQDYQRFSTRHNRTSIFPEDK